MACSIDEGRDTFAESDRECDHDDRAGDHPEETPAFVRKPGHQYASRFPDPITGHPLQIWPHRQMDEFESEDDFWKWLDAVSRHNNGLPPARAMPDGEDVAADLPTGDLPRPGPRRSRFKSRHVGVRLTERDFAMLKELAVAHAVPPGTMARMLIVRGVRAAANKRE